MLTKQQRQLIITLKQEGKTQEYIANLLGCTQATVSKWIAKYLSGRTLETLPRSGRPTKLSASKLKKIRSRLLSKIKEANEKYCSLSTKQLGDIIKQEVGKSYSIRHIERLMHRLGFSLIKPRPNHIRHDQKKVDEFREQFKKNSNRNTWIMSS